MSKYALPTALAELATFLESLPEGERRENLIDLAAQAEKYAPQEGERFDVEDVRHDAECTDTVGVHLRSNERGATHLAVSLGPKVQTLTRAFAVILCRGLEGSPPEVLCSLRHDFVPRLIGAELVRQRSQTVYYVLRRIQEAAQQLLDTSRFPRA